MGTATRLGPGDHGRTVTLEELHAGEVRPGNIYELVRGRLAVAPFPEVPEAMVADWLAEGFLGADASRKAWIYIHDTEGTTVLRPDLAVYADLPPRGRARRGLSWPDLTPRLVVEVIDPGHEDKDLVRNPPLYLSVPSIREYWVLDGRRGWGRAELVVHERRAGAWHITTVAGAAYTTTLFPGMNVTIDPSGYWASRRNRHVRRPTR